jgi:peptide/nickel transport system permease protein
MMLEVAVDGEPQAASVREADSIRDVPRRGIDPLLAVGLSIVVGVLLLGLLAPFLTPHDPLEQEVRNRFAPPSGEHWLGTDRLGRDVFTRLLYAARIDIPLAIAATLLAALIGTVLGALAGYAGRRTDAVVMRVADVVQAFPMYVFLVALVFVLGPGAPSFLVAAACISWVGYARLARADVLRLASSDFVVAAKASGLGHRRVLIGHLMPNVMPQIYAYLASDAVIALVALSSLSFLQLGVQPPTPEWGQMVADGVDRIRAEWWLSTAPGVAIVIVGVGLSLMAYGMERQVARR